MPNFSIDKTPYYPIILAILAFVFLAFSGTANANPSEIEIILLKGQVEIRQGQSASWVKAERGLFLQAGDTVRTGSESEAVIRHISARIHLYENTSLELPAPQKGQKINVDRNDYTSIIMEKGHALIEVFKERMKRRFQVITPTLIAGVKGTVFKVFEKEDLKGVSVVEGVVEVTNLLDSEEIIELKANHFTLLEGARLTEAMELRDDHDMYIDMEDLTGGNLKDEIRTKSKDLKDELRIDSKDLKDELRIDSKDLKDELRIDSKDLKDELRIDSKDLKDELRADSKDLKDELRADSKDLKDELRTDSKDLKDELRTESKDLKDELRADSKDLKDELKNELKLIEENKK